MIRYIISLIVFFVGITLMMVFGGSVNYFFDLPSFLIVGIFPFLFVSVLFGFKKVWLVFSRVLKETDKNQLSSALYFFKMYEKVTWITSFIAILIGFISMLGDLGNESAWGSYMAVMLISPLYGALINLAIIIPFTIMVKKHFI